MARERDRREASARAPAPAVPAAPAEAAAPGTPPAPGPGAGLADGLPLTEYGLIGDCRTAALVSRAGSVDWWCAPRFDSPSVFARLLDPRGGHFLLEVEGAAAEMAYEEGTNVLRRTWRAPGGEAAGWDFLVWPPPAGNVAPRIVRCMRVLRGRVAVRMAWSPRPDYARGVPEVEASPWGAVARGGGSTLILGSDQPMDVDRAAAAASARVELVEGERAVWLVRHEPGITVADQPRVDRAWDWLAHCIHEWRAWDARTVYRGPHAAAVRRSALALKALTYEPSGAVVAAPTTSLPEAVGGVRNWDYRYVWIRDAWLLAEALFEVGHPNQAAGLLRWLLQLGARHAPELRIMYPVRPDIRLDEEVLDHLAGWRGSRPVRIGNAAHEQLQLDVYGQLIGGLHACELLGRDVARHAWPFLREVVDLVATRWREPDAGIWEFRATPRHFVHSKVMAWVALDRGARAARASGLEGDVDRWEGQAAALRDEVLARGWNPRVGAFVQSYGSEALDAANLLIPMVGFLPPEDPRCLATVERIEKDLAAGPFVHRYRADDGLPPGEGAFVFCSFWRVDNLVLQGRLDEARAHFDALVAIGGLLGLLAEEVDPASGELLGNYPQGFSHIGLIRSALLLSAAERGALRRG